MQVLTNDNMQRCIFPCFLFLDLLFCDIIFILSFLLKAKRCHWMNITNSDSEMYTQDYMYYGDVVTVTCDYGYGLGSNLSFSAVDMWCRPDGYLMGSTESCSRMCPFTFHVFPPLNSLYLYHRHSNNLNIEICLS